MSTNPNHRITTSDIKKPDSPQFKLRNPQRKSIFVILISILADPEFSKKGEILIKINQNVVFYTKNTPIKNYSMLPIKLNEELLNQKYLEIFAWNGVDSNTIGFDFDVKFGDSPENISVSAIPLGKDVFNDVVSESSELFPFRVYNNETVTKLIDMEGYKKLLVTISASTIPAITEEQGPDQSSQGTVVDVLYDITQASASASLAVSGYEETDSYDVDQIIDLGSTRNRSLTVDKNKQTQTVINAFNWHNAGTNPTSDGSFFRNDLFMDKTETYDISESDDPTFATGVTILETAISDIPNPLVTTKRYIKIVEHVSISFSDADTLTSTQNNIGSNQPDVTVSVNYNKVPTLLTNWLDTLSQGGQVDLSWEILGSGGQWFELISSAEFGTITQGNQVITQVGDAVSRVNTDKIGFVLPSTQTSFRAKLVATNGIETGISIIRVA